MKAVYERWLLFNLNQLLRHTGVAVTTWAGIGISENHIDVHKLWIAFVAGAIVPSFTALCSKGIPMEETTEETKTNDEKT